MTPSSEKDEEEKKLVLNCYIIGLLMAIYKHTQRAIVTIQVSSAVAALNESIATSTHPSAMFLCLNIMATYKKEFHAEEESSANNFMTCFGNFLLFTFFLKLILPYATSTIANDD